MKDKARVIIADSNIIVKWFIPEEYSEYAVVLRDDHLYGRVNVIAPVYAILEFANSMRKYVIRGILSKDKAIKALEYLEKTNVTYVDIEFDLAREALKYAMENHVTAYDSYYIVLARKHNTVMYTADEKLLNRLKGRENHIKHIIEYVKDRKDKKRTSKGNL